MPMRTQIYTHRYAHTCTPAHTHIHTYTHKLKSERNWGKERGPAGMGEGQEKVMEGEYDHYHQYALCTCLKISYETHCSMQLIYTNNCFKTFKNNVMKPTKQGDRTESDVR